MKKKLLILIMALCIIILSGCGSKKEYGVVTVWWPGGSDAEIAIMHRAKELYEADHEGVEIKIIPQSTTNFYMSYSMSLNGADYPDIAYVDHVYVQRLMNDGNIANLSDLGFDELQPLFIDSLWAPNTYEGKLYALPISANVLVTVYNKTLLTQVTGKDFTNEDLPKNYEEFKTLSKTILDYNTANNLTGDDAYIPITIPAGNGNESMAAMTFLSYVSRENGKIISDDLKTMTLNSDECIKAAEKIKELGSLNYTTGVFSESRFESGRVAFIEMGPWKFQDYDRISEQKNIEFGYAPAMKFYDGGNNSSALGLFSMVVTEQSPNKEIAADFIKFVATNDELQLLHNKPQNLMPTTKTAITNEFYTGERWEIFTNQLNNVVARPGSPEWPTIEMQLAGFVTQLISGTREPKYLNDLNYALQEALNEIYE